MADEGAAELPQGSAGKDGHEHRRDLHVALRDERDGHVETYILGLATAFHLAHVRAPRQRRGATKGSGGVSTRGSIDSRGRRDWRAHLLRTDGRAHADGVIVGFLVAVTLVVSILVRARLLDFLIVSLDTLGVSPEQRDAVEKVRAEQRSPS